MGLLDGLERLINEHGSSAILKERIELANDKYAALEEQAATLSQENEALKRENAELIERLRELEGQQPQNQTGRLEELQEKLLLLLASSEETPESAIARHLGENPQVIAFHLRELSEAKLANRALMVNKPSRWYISHEGRRYLIKNNLLK